MATVSSTKGAKLQQLQRTAANVNEEVNALLKRIDDAAAGIESFDDVYSKFMSLADNVTKAAVDATARLQATRLGATGTHSSSRSRRRSSSSSSGDGSSSSSDESGDDSTADDDDDSSDDDDDSSDDDDDSSDDESTCSSSSGKAAKNVSPRHSYKTLARPLSAQRNSKRVQFTATLRSTPYTGRGNPAFFHGRLYGAAHELPQTRPAMTWQSSKPPRKGHGTPGWLTASEHKEVTPVLNAKCELLAAMLRCSKKTVIYTGAGISVASGIGQAAAGNNRKAKGFKGSKVATPSYTHRALAALEAAGFIDSWVQQNHDGLPQKAGFPQEKINEVHGSWFDPSNPVVKYTGSLKDTEYDWLEHDEETADLVLVLGTSLSGLCADGLVSETAKRSRRGAALGSVIINLQQTQLDGGAALRIFEHSDAAMKCLAGKLGVKVPGDARLGAWAWAEQQSRPQTRVTRVAVPYNADGQRSRDPSERTWLDLSVGQRVRLNPRHNIQGAKQPQFMHIGAKRASTYRGATRRPGKGVGTVVGWEPASASIALQIDGVPMRLGMWWLEAAQRGGPHELPLTNLRPQVAKLSPPAPPSASRPAGHYKDKAPLVAAGSRSSSDSSKGGTRKGGTRKGAAVPGRSSGGGKKPASSPAASFASSSAPVGFANAVRSIAESYAALE